MSVECLRIECPTSEGHTSASIGERMLTDGDTSEGFTSSLSRPDSRAYKSALADLCKEGSKFILKNERNAADAFV